MAEEKDIALIIFLSMIVTIIPRIFPMLINSDNWSKWVKESLEFLPIAIVSSVVFPSIILNNYSSYFLSTEFITVIATIIIALLSKNLFITVIVSLFIYYLLDNYMF